MMIDFVLQVCFYVYYYLSTQNGQHYLAFPFQAASFCLLIILVNVCIWLSLEFADGGYKICCRYCHDYQGKKIKNDVMSGRSDLVVDEFEFTKVQPQYGGARSRLSSASGVPIDTWEGSEL